MQTVVVGGGLVGAAAALSLAQAGHQVSLIEAVMPEPSADIFSAPAKCSMAATARLLG